jgi:hypothetical protein
MSAIRAAVPRPDGRSTPSTSRYARRLRQRIAVADLRHYLDRRPVAPQSAICGIGRASTSEDTWRRRGTSGEIAATRNTCAVPAVLRHATAEPDWARCRGASLTQQNAPALVALWDGRSMMLMARGFGPRPWSYRQLEEAMFT